MLLLVAVLLLLTLSGCAGSAAPQSAGPGSAAAPSVTMLTGEQAEPSGLPNPLFGTWRRVGSCTAFVGAMQAAGLSDLIGLVDGTWMAGGVTPKGSDPTAADYCRGAREVSHSHSFGADGQFASQDENGQQVDDGTYELVGTDTLVFGPMVVRYHIDADDHLSFDEVIAPDTCAASGLATGSLDPAEPGACLQDQAWAISAFYPGSYQRVP